MACVVGTTSTLVLTVAASAPATPGDLDPTFSGDGIAQIDFPDRSIPDHPVRDTFITATLAQSDGRAIVAGYTTYVGQCLGHLGCTYFPRPSATRLNPDGSVDPTFAAQSTLEADFGLGANLVPDAWALQSNDRLLLAGRTNGGFYVARLTRDGALDTSFSGDGFTVVPWPEHGGGVRLVLQSGGRIVIGTVVTENQATIDHSLVLMRVLPDGTQDMSFGSGGVVDKPAGPTATLGSVLVDASDRIVLGRSNAQTVPGRIDLIFNRLDPDGGDDATFGSGGSTTYEVTDLPLDDEPEAVIDSAGRIVSSFNAGRDQRGLLRLHPNGDFDETFGVNGARFIDDLPKRPRFLSGALLSGLAVQADGSPLVARATASELLLGRRAPDGAADRSFAGDGWARNYPFHPFAADSTPELLVAPDGRILLATGGRGVQALVARYRIDTDPPNDADTDGVLDAGDRCPGRYDKRYGCPRNKRSLGVHAGRGGVAGRLKVRPAERACLADAKVIVFAKRRGPDRRLGADDELDHRSETPGRSAAYAVELPRRFEGSVYARIERELDPKRGICTGARSKAITLG